MVFIKKLRLLQLGFEFWGFEGVLQEEGINQVLGLLKLLLVSRKKVELVVKRGLIRQYLRGVQVNDLKLDVTVTESMGEG